MLMPIAGKKPATEASAKEPAAKPQRKSAQPPAVVSKSDRHFVCKRLVARCKSEHFALCYVGAGSTFALDLRAPFFNVRCEMHLSNSQDPAERPTILLIEDEDLLREMLEETLVEAGYGVLSAASGEEARDLLSGKPLPRARVTDINLDRARMDGWELARLARENDAGCVILYVSGDSGHRWAANGVPRSVLLAKPFAPSQLVEEISSLLLRCGAAPR